MLPGVKGKKKIRELLCWKKQKEKWKKKKGCTGRGQEKRGANFPFEKDNTHRSSSEERK